MRSGVRKMSEDREREAQRGGEGTTEALAFSRSSAKERGRRTVVSPKSRLNVCGEEETSTSSTMNKDSEKDLQPLAATSTKMLPSRAKVYEKV